MFTQLQATLHNHS